MEFDLTSPQELQRLSMRSPFPSAVLLVLLATPMLQADVVRLNQGGEVRGLLLEQAAETDAAYVEVETLDGVLIQVPRENVAFTERRSRLIEEYQTRVRTGDNSLEAHWELAEWCRSMKLYDERDDELKMILAIDPDHKEARRILGYQNYSGKWMTREEFMTSQGYVHYKGKWITPQERDLREKTDAQREAEGVWFPKVRLWVGWLNAQDPNRRQAGLAQLRQLSDPDALAALSMVMREHRDDQVRLLYVDILTRLPESKGSRGLVDRLLFDPSAEVRHMARAAVTPEIYPRATPLLLESLSSADNSVVRRAAEVLGDIGNPVAVPGLIRALVTSHRITVQVPTNTAVTFGQSANGRVGMLSPGQTVLPPQIAGMLATGQLPYGVNVIPYGAQPQRMRTVAVQVEVTNPQVLDALRKITGKDLGYNDRDWELWWALQQS